MIRDEFFSMLCYLQNKVKVTIEETDLKKIMPTLEEIVETSQTLEEKVAWLVFNLRYLISYTGNGTNMKLKVRMTFTSAVDRIKPDR